MVDLQAALRALTVPGDGVDGSAIYVYGEGWDFGEVQANRIGVNAAQQNIGDTGIGVFNDRIRDALRGGSAFDNPVATATDPLTIRQKQGFSSGLFVDPNESRTAADLPDDKTKLLNQTDWIKLGLAGNLKAFPLTTALQTPPAFRTGDKVGYNGAKAAYTTDPQENVNYASAHDNQTLWDILQYKAPAAWTPEDRVRGYDLALDAVLLGQGIPFFHLGDELLRSKSMDKNSYDSGDWFNRVDWTLASNGWKSGLPIIEGDAATQSGWESLIRGIYSNASTTVATANIQAAYDHFREMLAVRRSSPLFRLRTGAEVIQRLHFLNAGKDQQPGVVVMTITDDECAGADVDVDREGVVVIINADRVARTMAVPGGTGAVLHPALAASVDPIVRTAAVSGTDFTVPARTTAVFVVPNGGAAGTGLPCNPFAP
jgi:pullulanase